MDIQLASLKEELTPAYYGVDSLLALSITGRTRDELEVDSEAFVLLNCETPGQSKPVFNELNSQDSSPPSGSSAGTYTEFPSLLTIPGDDNRDMDHERSAGEDLSSSLLKYPGKHARMANPTLEPESQPTFEYLFTASARYQVTPLY